MKRTVIAASIVVMLIGMTGCASYSGIAPQGSKLTAESLGVQAKQVEWAKEWPQADWWLALNDDVLNGLVTEALKNSPDLKEADARLQRAQAIVGYVDSTRYPQVQGSVSTTRQRYSENGLVPKPYAGTVQSSNDLSVSASWEVDFFGKNSESLQSAIGELRATEAEHQAARILLTTNIVRSYFTLARFQLQQEIAAKRSKQANSIYTLEQSRVEAGIDADAELEPIKGNSAESHRDIASADEQVALSRHALAALLGKGPDAAREIKAQLPVMKNLSLPETLPVELLGHRADIVAAKWRVESMLHGVEAAKAMFYPNVNLRGFTGFSSIGFDRWLDGGSRQPGAGLAISLPIFDADRLRNEYAGITAQTDSVIASYNKLLITAFRDVADQLASLQAIEQQLKKQNAVVNSAKQSHALAQQRYDAGITGVLPVLTAEGNLLTQQRILIDLEARWADGQIKLIHALGGGFVEQENKTLSHEQQQDSNNEAHHG